MRGPGPRNALPLLEAAFGLKMHGTSSRNDPQLRRKRRYSALKTMFTCLHVGGVRVIARKPPETVIAAVLQPKRSSKVSQDLLKLGMG